MVDLNMLNYIDPDDYDTWIKVGMALKHEGCSVDTWIGWSRSSNKYQEGECERKWNGFRRDEVTGGTLYHIARQHGYVEDTTNNYDIRNLLLDEAIVDPSFVSIEKVPKVPNHYNPKGDMLEYFTTLFQPGDFVGLGLDFWQDKDGKWKPGKTQYRRTYDDIVEKLRSGSIESALGALNEYAGAYVRFNPLDGKGEGNANVTRWKYCLIESDTDSIEKQYTLYKAMNLPIEFIVSSGGHSLHAITRVDAENAQQYRQRVQEIYSFCKKNGLTPDEQDKNESRFSRLPGVKRGDNWQYIVARQIGAASYDEWIEWRQDQADDLPEDTTLSDIWDTMPPLKPELIPGVLRMGHKLLLAGPSKAGKSFLLMDLAISMAEGVEWLGMQCRQGKVCYVNLELDAASCFHRFRDIYQKRGLEPKHIDNIIIWNLRGHAVPMDRLAPVLIHRFKEKDFEAVIIDPIYKVITGDENSATDMSKFCSYFDQVATEMNVATIYCHHHSKSATGKYANAADRSSGSGVFARDPDAILDLSEIKVDGLTDKYKAQYPDACGSLTGWEMSGTLREFAPMSSKRIWFDYPIHRVDEFNFLASAKYSDMGGRGVSDDQTPKEDWYDMIEMALSITGDDSAVRIETVGMTVSNARRICGKNTDYEVATVGDDKVIHKRLDNTIRFEGKIYQRQKAGRGDRWVPNSELQNLI